MKVNIPKICDTRWMRAGKITDEEYAFVFPGSEIHKNREGGVLFRQE